MFIPSYVGATYRSDGSIVGAIGAIIILVACVVYWYMQRESRVLSVNRYERGKELHARFISDLKAEAVFCAIFESGIDDIKPYTPVFMFINRFTFGIKTFSDAYSFKGKVYTIPLENIVWLCALPKDKILDIPVRFPYIESTRIVIAHKESQTGHINYLVFNSCVDKKFQYAEFNVYAREQNDIIKLLVKRMPACPDELIRDRFNEKNEFIPL